MLELNGAQPNTVYLKWRPCDEPRAHNFEVWSDVESKTPDGRNVKVAERRGYIVIQQIPTWLSKVRGDESSKHTPDGWLPENYLPYFRPKDLSPWPEAKSPLPPPKRRPKRQAVES
ncbi:hypothetical protein ACQ858_14910 [Variovorax ureilyticus]|uniref:hypothetical protein n=1 Tax=Variovorax ureilyticus TaxID=1836198 RepID=UPI003D66C6E4